MTTFRQHLALGAAFFLCVALLAPTLAELHHLVAGSDHVGHADGAPCPDPQDGGHPCGPLCHCVCCPGHVVAMVSTVERLKVEARPSASLDLPFIDDTHTNLICSRVYHPPRA